jgi:hypothetical protein
MRLLLDLNKRRCYSPDTIWRGNPNLISQPPGDSSCLLCVNLYHYQEDLTHD